MTDPSDPRPSYRLITSTESLAKVIPDLMDETVIAVDVEADSMFHFNEQVCLIQIASPGMCLIIDPLAVRDLALLKPLFLSSETTKIVHGASYDVRCLDMCCDIQINNLFDTEIACRFLGMGETGLNAVVQSLFQVTLDKKYQKKDWSRRPLSDEMLEYAARDVLYLIPLWKIIKKQLAQKKRSAWVAEECRLISLARPAPENGQPLFVKVKGSGRLDRRSLAVLENLLKKRLEIAERKNLPPFKVIGNKTLIGLAEEKPRHRNALRRSQLLSDKQMAMYAEPVCRAIQKGLDLKEADLPVYPRQKRSPLSRKAAQRVDALKQWRETAAAEHAMDAGLILPNALAITIAREKPQTVRQLDAIAEMKKWQKKTFGRDIVAIVNEHA